MKRSKSEGELNLSFETNSLHKYIDTESENRIVTTLGKKYAGSVRLYRFPIDVCEQLKAYRVLEQNKSDEANQRLKEMIEQTNKGPFFFHDVKSRDDKLFFSLTDQGVRRNPISVTNLGASSQPSVLFEPELDFNSLAIISHKLAEKFAKDSGGKFEAGPLFDTELVEFHTYTTAKIENKQQGSFDKHFDDETVVSYKTITLIWYLIKDEGVNGANITFFSDITDKQIREYYKTGKEPKSNEVTIDLWNQKDGARENCVCLIFKGNVEHIPEMMSGTGERSAIVYHFIRIDKPDRQGGNKSSRIKRKRKSRNRNTIKGKKPK